jgi:hypothetical protein
MQRTLIVIAMFIAGVCAPLTSFAQNLSVGNWIMNAEELATTQDSLSSGQVVRQWNEICRAQDFGNPCSTRGSSPSCTLPCTTR